jgi:AcrR family transcriptional regulator
MADRRTRRHTATRQEIIDAAWLLARERGLTGWSLRELADAVDMRAPSLYGYFASKEQIYDAMYAQGYEELQTVVDATPRTGGSLAVLRRAAHQFVTFAVADSARLQLLFLRVVPGFAPSAASYARAEQVLDTLRAEFAAAGLEDPRSLDLYTALVTGLATQQVSNDPGGDRWTSLIDHAMDMFLVSELPKSPGVASGQ